MNLANVVAFTKTKYLLFSTITNFVTNPIDSNFSSWNLVTVDIRKVKTFQIHVMFNSRFYYKKNIIFLFFCGCTSLGLDKIMVDYSISVLLLLWNRLRMSDKFFNFFYSFYLFYLGQKRYL